MAAAYKFGSKGFHAIKGSTLNRVQTARSDLLSRGLVLDVSGLPQSFDGLFDG